MSRLVGSFVPLAAIIAAIVFSCPLAEASDPSSGGGPPVRMTVESTGMSWQPVIDYGSAVLTVSGPGEISVRREFGADEALAFQVNDSKRAVLADGEYTWELRFAPVLAPAVKRALDAARESGDSAEVEALKRKGALPAEPLMLSGYFRIKDGWIVVDDVESAVRSIGRRLETSGVSGAVDTDSGAPTKDQVILDDLIVDGSACIGFDCVNGESFGFDTIRIKENNLRIKAQDTSSSASFPTNDWQITFNDSANGGANKFSIDDIDGGRTPFTIEASAPSNSLYVDDGGRVGFGTATPVVDLHVISGNTPTLRLEQDGSSGFTPQTWDVAGNEAGFFIRDATNGSTLPFRILPGASSSTLVISGSDNVGIGAGTSPTDKLHIVNGDFRVERTTAGGSDHAALFLEQSGSAVPSSFAIRANATTGSLEIKEGSAGASALKFRIGAANNSIVVAPGVGGSPRVGIGDTTPSGTLDVAGTIYLSGAQIHPDFVFEPNYSLESIEEHAEYMWTNKHLPAVGPGEYDENGMARFELGKSHVGLLEELEKAHIYIEQLNDSLNKLRGDRLVALEAGMSSEVEELRKENEELMTRNAGHEVRIKELESALAEVLEHMTSD